MKLNKKINIPLIIIAIIIYGLVVVKVMDYFNSNRDDSITNTANDVDVSLLPTAKKSIDNSDSLFEFKSLPNDPFTFSEVKKIDDTIKTHKKTVIKEPVYVPPLQYKINGIIINNDNKMITLLDLSNNKTIFLREGETYSSLKIKSISKDKVEVVENGVVKSTAVE